jgi:hypothetical protein
MAMASGKAAPRDLWPGPEPPDLACPAGMRRVRFEAMGTAVSMLLPERIDQMKPWSVCGTCKP